MTGILLGLPFVDVSVDRFPPTVREWLKEKTKKTSVPQIFFNETHVGGNAEFQALVKDDAKFQELLNDVTNNEAPDESDPYLPNPADAIDVPKNLKGGAEFHCELDEYAAFVQVHTKFIGCGYHMISKYLRCSCITTLIRRPNPVCLVKSAS